MTEKIKRLYARCISDERFMKQLAIHEPDYSNPRFFWGPKVKTIIAMVYMGFLIAKNEYRETDYE